LRQHFPRRLTRKYLLTNNLEHTPNYNEKICNTCSFFFLGIFFSTNSYYDTLRIGILIRELAENRIEFNIRPGRLDAGDFTYQPLDEHVDENEEGVEEVGDEGDPEIVFIPDENEEEIEEVGDERDAQRDLILDVAQDAQRDLILDVAQDAQSEGNGDNWADAQDEDVESNNVMSRIGRGILKVLWLCCRAVVEVLFLQTHN
jgi:hypothetical protein